MVWPDTEAGASARYRNRYVYDALGRVTRVCDGATASSAACATYASPLAEVS